MWSNERESSIMKNSYVVNIRCKTTNIMLGTMPGDEDIFRSFILKNAPDAMTRAQEIEASGIDKVERDGMTVFPRGLFYLADDGRYFDPIYGKDLPDPEKVPGHFEVVPFIWDYQWRGSFKESIGMIQRAGGKAKKAPAPKKSKKAETPENATMPESSDEALAAAEAAIAAATPAGGFACSKIAAYKKVVDGNWFVKQRRIPLRVPKTFINDLGKEVSSFEDITMTKEDLEELGMEVPFLKAFSRALRAETMQGPRVAIAKSEFVPIGTEFWFTVELLNPADKQALIECLDLKEKIGMLQWRSGGKGTLIWTPCDEYGNPIDEMP